MSVFSRRRAATRLGRYWNARVRGADRQALGRLSTGIDHDLLEQIEVVRRGHDLQAPDPQFVARLERDLLRAISNPAPRAEEQTRWVGASRNRSISDPRRSALPEYESAPSIGRRLGVWAVTAVVVLLVLVVGLAGVFDDPEPQTLPFRAVDPNTPVAMTPVPTPVPTLSPLVVDSLNGIAEPLWVTSDTGSGTLEHPGFTNIDPEGRIWVVDGVTNTFVIYALDGTYLETWGAAGSGPGQFEFRADDFDLGDIAFAPDGRFFVADPANRRVQAFDADRQFLFSWGDAGDGSGDGQFLLPASVVVASDGTILVSDVYRNDVQRFGADGTYLGRFETPGSPADQFNEAGSITIAPDGTVWVVGHIDAQIHRFNADGTFLNTIGAALGEPGELFYAWEVAFDADGNAHVANMTLQRITVFAPDGTYLADWGAYGTEPGQLFYPSGISIVGDTAYVTESGNEPPPGVPDQPAHRARGNDRAGRSNSRDVARRPVPFCLRAKRNVRERPISGGESCAASLCPLPCSWL